MTTAKPSHPKTSPGSGLSRRALLRQIGAAPLLLRASALRGWTGLGAPAAFATDSEELRYVPHYPVRSPLEDVLRLVPPGLDEFPSEKYAAQLEAILSGWARLLKAGTPLALAPWLTSALRASPLEPEKEVSLRAGHGIECFERTFHAVRPTRSEAFLADFAQWLGSGSAVREIEFQITALTDPGPNPETLLSEVRYSLTTQSPDGRSEQRVGNWLLQWAQAEGRGWQLTSLTAHAEIRTILRGSGFTDITEHALGDMTAYRRQLAKGSDYWRTVLDGACGIDVYGNNGIAAGDFDNDGFDDLYISQPAGLPNRLLRNRGDGTFEDVTEKAGVGVLDNTACALFADFRNLGLQDLLVVCGSGPLLFVNRGDGTFQRKLDAFRFARSPQGTFTSAAIADYDRDGRLDIYFCLYSYYLGLDQYHYPTPYFDARNGPPNFLMHNQGDGTFVDRTEASGLQAENDRYSFACAWSENGGTHPDLYVVNDFGRNNLYRSQGDGTFQAVSASEHVQDVGAGMSAAWGDFANSGRPGLYVANMWSAAGQRVSHLAAFHASAGPEIRELYQRHARGNALYRNDGSRFSNVSEQTRTEMGRWAWGSDFLDFDHDGHQDLYVANGYITAPSAPSSASTDLGSFFWRQVVGRSPEDATPSPAYEHGWNALNELIRTDSSWSGHERNVLLTNLGDGTFAEASGALGLDFLEDGRAFALADLDGDGRLEIIVKNRNGPQMRILHNDMQQLGDSIVFRLRGTTSNRDGIGTTMTLTCGSLVQTRSLQAGSGFLSQHSKEVLFGLGSTQETVSAVLRWPSGTVQRFEGLPRNHRVRITEGEHDAKTVPFSALATVSRKAPAAVPPEVIPTAFATWLLDPLKAPSFTLTGPRGPVSLDSFRGHPVLIHCWTSESGSAQQHLHALDAIPPARLAVLALNFDEPARQKNLPAQDLRLPVLLATPEIAGIYNIVFRYLFDRRANLPLPTSFLLDANGMIVRVYQGPVRAEDLLADLRAIPSTPAQRALVALPFPGTLHQGSFERNDFTYGVAMFQHGYLDQAAASFEQVIQTRPDDAEAHYNLGTLNLRRNNFPAAREQLQQTLKLKPDYPEAWNNLGMMAAQQGQTQDAIASFEQSLALRPTYATALLNLGNLYRREQDFAQAERYLQRALALQPDDPETNYSMGMAYAQQGQLPSAEQSLRKAITLCPDYPEALNNLGVLYVRQNDTAGAEQQFLTCLRLNPAYETTYLNLARLYLTEGEKRKARQVIEDLLRQNPESVPGKRALEALDRQ